MRFNTAALLTIAALAVVVLSSCAGNDDRSKASVTDVNGIDVVSLYGTWEEMGEQYGELAGRHLRHVDEFISGIIDGNGPKRDSIIAVSNKLYSRYPYRFRQFFKGMEKTSGLTMEQLLKINAVEYAEGYFCSGIAAWGEYASGDLVYGRNYDAMSYAPIGEDVIITVFHPSDGSLATATIGYAGEIYAVNAINEKGVFLELNNGMPSGGFAIDFDRFASTTSLLEVMFDAYDLDYLDAFFKTHRSFASFIIGVADKNEARSYEWCPSGTENASESTPEGLMAQANHYVSPNWTYPVPTDETSWQSITRRCNLIGLAESNKGRIDAETMCRLIATPISEGGAMQEGTRYQIVFTPATKQLMLRVEKQPEWVEVDLNDFM